VFLVPYNVRQQARPTDDGSQETMWVYDLIRAEPVPGGTPSALAHWRRETVAQLNRELQKYIYSVYDPGTQATINGYAARALAEGRSDIVTECRKVQDWVDRVLDYYDTTKQALVSAASEEERMDVTWNFPREVPISEYVDWRDIKAMFGGAQ
jgi:hypothetical protein